MPTFVALMTVVRRNGRTETRTIPLAGPSLLLFLYEAADALRARRDRRRR